MRKILIAACIFAQLTVLGYMVFARENIISNGTKISLSTAPIDPRDPFRGDFVRLRYALNNLQNAPARWQPENYIAEKGDKVYAILALQPSGLHELEYFTNKKPENLSSPEKIALRGRFTQHNGNFNNRRHGMKFGIEQLYVEQDSGIDIEQRQGVRGGMQNAMHVALSVSNTGTTVLTDYSWSELAIELEMTDQFALADNEAISNTEEPASSEEPAPSGEPPTSIRVHIQNVSDAPVTLNNPGNNCGFTIEPAMRFNSAFVAVNTGCENSTVVAPMTLQPQQLTTLEIDLSEPRWHVQFNDNSTTNAEAPTNPNTAGDLRSFTSSTERFRIVYRSSAQSASVSSQAGNTNGFWSGDLLSQAFNPRGVVD